MSGLAWITHACALVAVFYYEEMPRRPTQPFSAANIRRLIESQLPVWLKACASDADTILLHEGSFGSSAAELILLGSAIKYATGRRKNVHISWAIPDGKVRIAGRQVVIDTTFRELPAPLTSSGRKPRRRVAS